MQAAEALANQPLALITNNAGPLPLSAHSPAQQASTLPESQPQPILQLAKQAIQAQQAQCGQQPQQPQQAQHAQHAQHGQQAMVSLPTPPQPPALSAEALAQCARAQSHLEAQQRPPSTLWPAGPEPDQATTHVSDQLLVETTPMNSPRPHQPQGSAANSPATEAALCWVDDMLASSEPDFCNGASIAQVGQHTVAQSPAQQHKGAAVGVAAARGTLQDAADDAKAKLSPAAPSKTAAASPDAAAASVSPATASPAPAAASPDTTAASSSHSSAALTVAMPAAAHPGSVHAAVQPQNPLTVTPAPPIPGCAGAVAHPENPLLVLADPSPPEAAHGAEEEQMTRDDDAAAKQAQQR